MGMVFLTQVKDQVSSFLVWNAAVGIIRIFSLLKFNHQPLIFWSILVLLQRVVKGFGANQERESAVSWGVQNLLQNTLDVSCPALVQPEVGGVGVPSGTLSTCD